MKEIRGDAKSVRTLLGGAKYAIDYYQREYRWEGKQVAEQYQRIGKQPANAANRRRPPRVLEDDGLQQ